nr:hypothetical protein [Tanacetum cinerariifolium]
MQEFWATAYVHQRSIRFKMNNKKQTVDLESFREMLHICPRIPGQAFAELPFEEEILEFIRFLGHGETITTLTDININKLYQPWRSFVSIINKCLTGKVLAMTVYDYLKLKSSPKPKASSRRKRSGSDTSITPSTATTTPTNVDVTPRITAAAKGKQPAKAKSPSDPAKLGGFGTDEGTGSKPGVSDVPSDDSEKEISWNSSDDEDTDAQEKDGDDDEGDKRGESDDGEEDDAEDKDEIKIDEESDGDETKEEESFDLIPRTPDGNGKEDQENDEFLCTIDENIKRIIKEQVKSQVKEQVSRILLRIEQSVNAQLEAEVLTRSSHSSRTSYAIAADLSEMELKKILIEKMEGNKSIQRSDEQRNLYKVLVDAYEADKTILDSYGGTVILKRRRDDDDQEEGPSAGSDRGSKRGEKVSASESAFIEEPVQTISQMDEHSYLVFETGADDQTIVQSSQHPKWFTQPKKPPTPDCDWNKTLPAVQGSTQTWISELAKKANSCSSFNELLDTPLDFSNFIMNRLRVDTPTLELLAGPTFELMKRSCTSLIELEYHLEEVYKATTNQLDWVNPEDYGNIKWIKDLVPRSMCIQEPINYDKNALWGVSHWGRKRQQFYGFAVNYYQKRINLTKPDMYRSDLKRREAYTAYSNPKGFIYQNKDKKNRLMRIDELHKFSDGTLTDVCNALDDRLKGIRMQYFPQTIWRKGDKDKAAAMIQAIDKMLKTKRIMRSLKRFVGGRLYEGDFRMLQRTI